MNSRKSILALLSLTIMSLSQPTSPSFAQTSMLSGAVETKENPSYFGSAVHNQNISRLAPPHAGSVNQTAARHTPSSYLRDARRFGQRHPMVKSAAIGAGLGAAAGGVTGLISGQGFFRGTAIGAGTGAGVGVVRSSQIMRRHPIARSAATGGLAGLGLGWSASHRGGVIGATTGIGTALGLGWGLYKNWR